MNSDMFNNVVNYLLIIKICIWIKGEVRLL